MDYRVSALPARVSRSGRLLAAGLLMVIGLAGGVSGEDAPPADHLRAFYWNRAEERLEEREEPLIVA